MRFGSEAIRAGMSPARKGQTPMDVQETRNVVARRFLDDPEAEPSIYDDRLYGLGDDWLILTDEEAEAEALERIRQDVWAFRSDFLEHYLPEGVTSDVIEALQQTKYEDAAPALLAMIGERFEEFADDAISADGRGHFLSQWDGVEHEIGDVDGVDWYAYRQ